MGAVEASTCICATCIRSFVACQARVAWAAVATRARLIGDPAAQWALVTDSGDSKLKPMPGEDNDRGGGDAGSGEGNMDKEDEVKGAEKRDDDGAAASAGGEDQKKRAEEESKKKALLLGGTLAITSPATKAPASAASSSSSSGGAQARRMSHLTHVLTGSTEAAQRHAQSPEASRKRTERTTTTRDLKDGARRSDLRFDIYGGRCIMTVLQTKDVTPSQRRARKTS